MNKGLEHQGKRRNLGKLIFLVADEGSLPPLVVQGSVNDPCLGDPKNANIWGIFLGGISL